MLTALGFMKDSSGIIEFRDAMLELNRFWESRLHSNRSTGPRGAHVYGYISKQVSTEWLGSARHTARLADGIVNHYVIVAAAAFTDA